MKRYCPTCKEQEMCRVIGRDDAGNPNVTICHRCGGRVI